MKSDGPEDQSQRGGVNRQLAAAKDDGPAVQCRIYSLGPQKIMQLRVVCE
jgi:hypothetical protein